MKLWLFMTSVFSACGWIVLAVTFYLAFFSGSAVITLNSFGEMYVEAFIIIPMMLILAVVNPIISFKIYMGADKP